MRGGWILFLLALGLAPVPAAALVEDRPLETLFGQGLSAHSLLPGTSRTAKIVFDVPVNTRFTSLFPAAVYLTYKKDVPDLGALTALAPAQTEEFSLNFAGMAQKLWKEFALTPLGGFAIRTVSDGMPGGDVRDLYSFAAKHFSFSPMLGLNVTRAFRLGDGGTLTPQVYAIYRYDVEDDEADQVRLSSMDRVSLKKASTGLAPYGLQAGVGMEFKLSENMQGHIGFDSNFQPGAIEQRAIFSMKYAW